MSKEKQATPERRAEAVYTLEGMAKGCAESRRKLNRAQEHQNQLENKLINLEKEMATVVADIHTNTQRVQSLSDQENFYKAKFLELDVPARRQRQNARLNNLPQL